MGQTVSQEVNKMDDHEKPLVSGNQRLLEVNKKLRREPKKPINPIAAELPLDLTALISGKDKSELERKVLIFDEIKEDNPSYDNEYIKLSKMVQNNNKLFKYGDKIQICSDRENTMRAYYGNGLIGTIFRAYSSHIPLTLRPDDLWITICTIFGNYVVKHSEEMRSCFVEHQGRKELTVAVYSPFLQYTTENHWCGFLNEMKKEIDKYVTLGITEWLDSSFSTTTYRDRVASNVVLMGAMKEYFSYKVMLCCGFPKITLEGSLDDWNHLVTKAHKLYEFEQKELSDWADLLIPVLEQFVEAYQGNIDKEFWQSACTSKSYGSGGQQKFRGWFLVFSPFDGSGKYLLNSKEEVNKSNIYGNVDDSDIIETVISTPVTIEDHTAECGDFAQQAGRKYESTVFAGMMMSEYNENTNTLRPTVDWGLIINPEITLDLMRDQIDDKFAKDYYQYEHYKDKKVKTKRHIEELLPFAYNAAKFYNFPQDRLTDLADEVYNYCYHYGDAYRNNLTGDELFRGFLLKLPRSHHNGHIFKKYVVEDEIEDAISYYKDESKDK